MNDFQPLPRPVESGEPDLNIDNLPIALGFVPNDRLNELRARFKEASSSSRFEAEAVWTEWVAESEKIVYPFANPPLGDPYWDRRLGATVEQGLMLRDGGKRFHSDYVQSLRFTSALANNIGNTQARRILEAALQAELSEN